MVLSALRRLAGSCLPLPELRSRSLPRCRAPGISPLPRRPQRAARPRATPGQGQDDRGGTGGAGVLPPGHPPHPRRRRRRRAQGKLQLFVRDLRGRAQSPACVPLSSCLGLPSSPQSRAGNREVRLYRNGKLPGAGSSGRRGRAQRHAVEPSAEKRGRRGLPVYRRSNKTRRNGDIKRTKVLCPV